MYMYMPRNWLDTAANVGSKIQTKVPIAFFFLGEGEGGGDFKKCCVHNYNHQIHSLDNK